MPSHGASASTRIRRFALLGGGISVLVLMVIVPGRADAAVPSGAMAECTPTGATASASAPKSPAVLELDRDLTGEDALQFDFFRARGPQSDTFALKTTDPLPPRGTELETILSPMRRAGAGGRLPTSAIRARAVVRTRDTVVVTVCISPGDVGEGSYQGAVGFADERVTAKPVRVVANLQYRQNLVVLFGGFGAGLAALAMTYLAASDSGERLLHWLRQPRTVVGIVAALLATIGVYYGSFSSDPDWRFAANAKTFVGIAYAAALAALGTVLGVAAGKDKTIAKAAAKVAEQQPDVEHVPTPPNPVAGKPADVTVEERSPRASV